MGNRKQFLNLHWIFKQLKNSKIPSEGVINEIPTLHGDANRNENT